MSVTSASKSKLQAKIDVGWLVEAWFKVRTVANLKWDFGLAQNICKTEMAGLRSRLLVVLFKLTRALAASKTTISDLCLRQNSIGKFRRELGQIHLVLNKTLRNNTSVKWAQIKPFLCLIQFCRNLVKLYYPCVLQLHQVSTKLD